MTKWYDVPALLAELTQCISDKWSATQTAAKISRMAGYPVSRNALIGKARRDHLGQFQSDDHGQYLRTPKAKRQVPHNVTRQKAPAIDLPAEAPQPADFLGLTIWQLEAGQCRAPSGDDPLTMVYCGQPVDSETSWCRYHRSVFTIRGSTQWQQGSSSTFKTTVIQRRMFS